MAHATAPRIVGNDPLDPPPDPARSFDEAVARTARFDSGETHPLLPTSHTRLLTHGRRTRRAVVLLHGITNNPQQWAMFGQTIHDELDANVLIPRLPHHGHADRLTSVPGRLTARMMAWYVGESVNIAATLGDEVAVVGLSAGGVYAAWAAQRRADVRLAVAIAPFFSVRGFPSFTVPLVVRAARSLPNQMHWWNKERRETIEPPHAYPQFSTRGLAATMELGAWVRRRARQNAPLARRIVFVYNEFDKSVHNPTSNELANVWRRHGANVEEYSFDDDPTLPHDMIDITQPMGQTDLVYAKLRDYLDD